MKEIIEYDDAVNFAFEVSHEIAASLRESFWHENEYFRWENEGFEKLAEYLLDDISLREFEIRKKAVLGVKNIFISHAKILLWIGERDGKIKQEIKDEEKERANYYSDINNFIKECKKKEEQILNFKPRLKSKNTPKL